MEIETAKGKLYYINYKNSNFLYILVVWVEEVPEEEEVPEVDPEVVLEVGPEVVPEAVEGEEVEAENEEIKIKFNNKYK